MVSLQTVMSGFIAICALAILLFSKETSKIKRDWTFIGGGAMALAGWIYLDNGNAVVLGSVAETKVIHVVLLFIGLMATAHGVTRTLSARQAKP